MGKKRVKQGLAVKIVSGKYKFGSTLKVECSHVTHSYTFQLPPRCKSRGGKGDKESSDNDLMGVLCETKIDNQTATLCKSGSSRLRLANNEKHII